MTIKDLKREKATLTKLLEIDDDALEALFELFAKGKLSKPDVLFKKTVVKVAPGIKYPFIYLELAKQSNFFMGFDFLLGSDLSAKIQKLKKEISKTKKAEELEELQLEEAFYLELDKLNPKGFLKGVAKFTEEKTTEKGVLESYFRPISSSISKKKITKKEIANLVNEFQYETKKGIHILFESMEEEEEEEQENIAITDEEATNETAIEVDPVEALAQAIKEQQDNTDSTVWLELLAEAEKLLASNKTKKLLTLKKIIQINIIKDSGVDIKDPASVKGELEKIVTSVEIDFLRFMNDDLKNKVDFSLIDSAHSNFYHTVMAAHTMMNTLAKVGKLDLQEAENFDQFKKPVSLFLQKASKARSLFKKLAINDIKIRKMAENRTQPGYQEKMEEILAQTKEYTDKLLIFLNK